jgi:hypothetical protein
MVNGEIILNRIDPSDRPNENWRPGRAPLPKGPGASFAVPIYPDIGRAIRNPNRDVGGSIEVDHRCPPNQRWNTVPVGGTGRVIADRKNLPVKFREHATKLHPAGWRPSGEAAYA